MKRSGRLIVQSVQVTKLTAGTQSGQTWNLRESVRKKGPLDVMPAGRASEGNACRVDTRRSGRHPRNRRRQARSGPGTVPGCGRAGSPRGAVDVAPGRSGEHVRDRG